MRVTILLAPARKASDRPGKNVPVNGPLHLLLQYLEDRFISFGFEFVLFPVRPHRARVGGGSPLRCSHFVLWPDTREREGRPRVPHFPISLPARRPRYAYGCYFGYFSLFTVIYGFEVVVLRNEKRRNDHGNDTVARRTQPTRTSRPTWKTKSRARLS